MPLAYFSLNTLPHTSVGLTICISIVFFSFEYFDPYDHYATCWVTLRLYKGGLMVTFTRPFQIVLIIFCQDDLFSSKGLGKVL